MTPVSATPAPVPAPELTKRPFPLARRVYESDGDVGGCPACGSSLVRRKWYHLRRTVCCYPDCGWPDKSHGEE